MEQKVIDRSKEIQETRKIVDRAIIGKNKYGDYVLTVQTDIDEKHYPVPDQYAREFAEAILEDMGVNIPNDVESMYLKTILFAAQHGNTEAAMWILRHCTDERYKNVVM